MRESLIATVSRSEFTWLPGFPHAAIALSTLLVFDIQACLAGLLMASLASFVVFLPLTALRLNGGKAIGPDEAPPELTPVAHGVLFWLWAVTVWGGAAAVGLSS